MLFRSQESETAEQQTDDNMTAPAEKPILTPEPTEMPLLTPTPTPEPTEKTESSRQGGKVTGRSGRVRTPVPEEILGIDLKL